MTTRRRGRSITLPCRVLRPALLGFLLLGHGGCSLEVTDPDVVDPEEVYDDPSSVSVVIAGLAGDFQGALDRHVLFSGVFVDEFIGISPTGAPSPYDRRDVRPSDVWEHYDKLHVSRYSSDRALLSFTRMQDDPAADPDLLGQGIAWAYYYAGYTRLLFAEMYCQSILGGGDPTDIGYEPAPLLPDERARQALERFQEAEQAALAAGMPQLAMAARLGQARSHLWLGEYASAATRAKTVDPDFTFVSEHSSSASFDNWNLVYRRTYGDLTNIGFTVGDGLLPRSNFEQFAFYEEWVNLGLIEPEPGPLFDLPGFTVPIRLQLIYGGGEPPPSALGRAAPIIIASGYEAAIVQAEAALRAGDHDHAEELINARLTTGRNPHGKAFAPVRLTGDFEPDIAEIGRAYAAGLWLTGHRLGFLRRVLRNDGVDMYPKEKPGTDTAVPMAQRELALNPAVDEACPTGPPWR